MEWNTKWSIEHRADYRILYNVAFICNKIK